MRRSLIAGCFVFFIASIIFGAGAGPSRASAPTVQFNPGCTMPISGDIAVVHAVDKECGMRWTDSTH